MLIRIYEDRDGPLSMRFPARGAGLSPFAMFGLCFELGRQACYDDKTGSLMVGVPWCVVEVTIILEMRTTATHLVANQDQKPIDHTVSIHNMILSAPD